ncbi:alpha-N-arabinofuranosidase [Demequina lutea]|uniref:non-reducing end alpha-L-arabinofuranosidase n=1 Tax=Demequina lutea TaxID=431489 RepID=A0A7Z0CLE6_9MICO|nr:alpha-L-arabinofuranosidase C-terminal domain-containing protein [Demequina lutea]NYI42812.1 alpha-N-arabinofuranosidase [Demequina lutea]
MSGKHVNGVIDLDVTGPKISRHLYGHFAEHLGRCIYGGFWVGEDSKIPHEGGIRRDVVEALRTLRIPNLRWPGGCFADEYHWRDGVGPRAARPRMVNSHWGDVVEDNSFGTHEFMALCDLLGAEPYVNGNVGSGTVREMSEWVEYLTREGDSPMASLRSSHGREKPWRVPFWGIGNEPWGCGGRMKADAYADLAHQYATYLRDHGENTLYRIAAGARDDDYSWTESLMKSIGCVTCPESPQSPYQAISFHYYTIPVPRDTVGSALEFSADDYYATMIQARRIDEIIRRHGDVMDIYDPQKSIGLVLDEWGTWHGVEPETNPGFLYQQNTMRDALVASVHFDAFHAHADRLVMANIAQTVNVLQAMVLTDPENNTLVLTPTYHVFAMNVGHHDALSLPVHITSRAADRNVNGVQLDTVSISASRKGENALVSLTNLDADDAVLVDLDLRGGAVVECHGRILTADSTRSHNTFESPEEVVVRDFDVASDASRYGTSVRLEIPAHSYVTVQVALA